MLEKIIEAKVSKYAKAKGFLCEKFSSPNNPSVPDRILTSPVGQIFFLEFKRKGKKPTMLQERDHNKRRDKCCQVLIIDDEKKGKDIIDVLSLMGKKGG